MLDQQLWNYSNLSASQSSHSYNHIINVPRNSSAFFSGIRPDILAHHGLKDYVSGNIELVKQDLTGANISEPYHGVRTITKYKDPVGTKGLNGRICYHVLAVYGAKVVTNDLGQREVVTECVTLFPEHNDRFSIQTDSTNTCSLEKDTSTGSWISLSKTYPERSGNSVDYKEGSKKMACVMPINISKLVYYCVEVFNL